MCSRATPPSGAAEKGAVRSGLDEDHERLGEGLRRQVSWLRVCAPAQRTYALAIDVPNEREDGRLCQRPGMSPSRRLSGLRVAPV